MGSFLTISITGYVGRNVELRYTTYEQKSVADFSVAVSRKRKNSATDQTLWVRVTCWEKTAEIAAQYVRKGSLVQVVADWVRLGTWLDKEGKPQSQLEVTARRLILLDRMDNGYEHDNGQGIAHVKLEDIDF